MSRNLSTEHVAAIVDNEGLSYTILHYGLKPEQIADEELRGLWNQAHTALSEIERILEPHMP